MTKHDNVSREGIMKATEFVKNEGLDEAKFLLDEWDGVTTNWSLETGFLYVGRSVDTHMLCLETLKRLVESHEILGLFKSLDQAKADVAACEYAGHADLLVKLDCGIGYINTARVKQAIADVEACQ